MLFVTVKNANLLEKTSKESNLAQRITETEQNIPEVLQIVECACMQSDLFH